MGCLCECMHVYVRAHTHTHAHTRAHTHTHGTHPHTHGTPTHTHTHTHTHTPTHTHSHTHTHTHTHTHHTYHTHIVHMSIEFPPSLQRLLCDAGHRFPIHPVYTVGSAQPNGASLCVLHNDLHSLQKCVLLRLSTDALLQS